MLDVKNQMFMRFTIVLYIYVYNNICNVSLLFKNKKLFIYSIRLKIWFEIF